MFGCSQTPKIFSKVRTTIAQFRMIAPGSRMVVAVSGGPDSVALLHLLHGLRSYLRCSLVVAHLDHGLRPESEEEAEFVARLAEGLEIPIHAERADVRGFAGLRGISIEDAGRRLRYDFFEQVRRAVGADAIATAHHRDDSLETFFLRIFRGSSLQGLGGIPPVRNTIIRPLIALSRKEILEFLAEHALPYRTDETNLQSDTDRNFVRNRLLPLVAERFPGFTAPLKRTIELIERETLFLDTEASRLSESVVSTRDDRIWLNLGALLRTAEVLRRRIVLQTLFRISGPDVRWGRVHVEAVLKIATGRNPSATVDLPGGLVVRREYASLIFEPGHWGKCGKRPAGKVLPEARKPAFRTVVRGPGTVEIAEAGIALVFRLVPATQTISHCRTDASTALFDADRLGFPFVLRPPIPGDRFRPWGLEGTRKLKKVLGDAKVPLHQRRTLPLLVKDEEIIWIPAVRRGAAAPVTPNTTRILEVTAQSMDENLRY
jgi:tRNA(Ile)-lysidine synthase